MSYVVLVKLAKPGLPGQCWEVDAVVSEEEFNEAGVKDCKVLLEKKLTRQQRPAKKGKSK